VIIRSVDFAGSLVQPGAPFPGTLPQIALSGRSNVGKSSLINTLLGRTRKREARVSARPGKTRALNFFEVNGAFFLVDLPGYGYAEVPDEVRDSWMRMVTWYLASGGPAAVVQLIDSRHDPTEADESRLELLADVGVPTVVALTKVDKLRGARRRYLTERVCARLSIDEEQVICFSSRTGEGRSELLEAVAALSL